MPTLRQQIVRTLRQEIFAGRYAPGVPMPGEHALCARFGVSRGTLRLALDELARAGLLIRQHGRGTFAVPVHDVLPRPLGFLLLEPQKAGTVGMMALLHGADTFLAPIGSHVTLLSTPPAQWHPTVRAALAGVLVVPTLVEAAHLAALAEMEIPAMVLLDSELPGAGVRFGLEEIAARLTDGLLALGHRRFALLSGHDAHADRLRKRGMARALQGAGIPPEAVPDFRTNYDPGRAWAAAQQILALRPAPTAVMAFDDTLALQMIRAAHEQGVRVPRDVSVTGFNDAPHAALSVPSISTVSTPMHEAGRLAAEAVCRAALRGEALASIALACEVRWRESTGPVSAAE